VVGQALGGAIRSGLNTPKEIMTFRPASRQERTERRSDNGSIMLISNNSLDGNLPDRAWVASSAGSAEEAADQLAKNLVYISENGGFVDGDSFAIATSINAVAHFGGIEGNSELEMAIANGLQDFIDSGGTNLGSVLRRLTDTYSYDEGKISSFISDLGSIADPNFSGTLFPDAGGLLYSYNGVVDRALLTVRNLPNDILDRRIEDPLDNAFDSINKTDLDHRWKHLKEGTEPDEEGVTIQVPAGRKGKWQAELNALYRHPNSTYIVGDYTFNTDSVGRVINVNGQLTLAPRNEDGSLDWDRNTYRQRQAARRGLPGDQGGHLIATIFRGPGELINLVPMDRLVNVRQFRNMERGWQSILSDGGNVHVAINISYENSATVHRPTSFNIVATENDATQFYDFGNGR